MLRDPGSSSTRQAGSISPASPAADSLRREISRMKSLYATYMGAKPPKQLAAKAVAIRMKDLVTALLKLEMATPRRRKA